MKILKESKNDKALTSPGWLNRVSKKIDELKSRAAEEQEVNESYISESIYDTLEEGTYFRVNDTNRSIYRIGQIDNIQGQDWAVFSSRHANATKYAALLSDLQKALDDGRIKILSQNELDNHKLRKGNEEI